MESAKAIEGVAAQGRVKPYSVAEFAQAAGIGLSSAWKEINLRRVGHCRVGPGGKKVVVTHDQLTTYLKQREVPVFDAVNAARKLLDQ